jgi:hypothetical protein
MRFVPSLLLSAFLTATLLAQQLGKAAKPTHAVPAKFIDVTSELGVHFQQMGSHTPKHYLLETMGLARLFSPITTPSFLSRGT